MSVAVITEAEFVIKIGKMSIYNCSVCRKNDLKAHYLFCPHCGCGLVFMVEGDDSDE